MINQTPSSFRSKFCALAPSFAIGIGVGAALCVSNGPATGMAVGTALVVVFRMMRHR